MKPKPPLGIEPEWIWKEKRFYALVGAIHRKFEAQEPGSEMPAEWMDELWELHRWMRIRRGESV